MSKLLIFSGNSNPTLAENIARRLEMSVSEATVGAFQDGETRVRLEESVRGADVFIIQSVCPPVDHNLMELLLMLDAAQRASAERVTAVIPYFGYARQDRKRTGREPISAKLVANLIATAGADRVLTMDLHSPAIEGFFDIPVDHLRATPLLADYFRGLPLSDLVVVSPDVGGVRRANRFRHSVNSAAGLAVVFKERSEHDEPEILGLVGEVEGKSAVIVDDLISTGETIIKAAELLAKRGAHPIYACAVHPVLAPGAVERLEESVIEKVIVTDTIPIPQEQPCEKIELVSMAPLLAKAIMYINKGLSMTALFKEVEAEWLA